MKYTFLIFFAMIIQSCSNNKIENSWEEANLSGKVLSYKEISYEALERFGEVEKGKRERRNGWKKDFVIIFDEDGNQLEEVLFHSEFEAALRNSDFEYLKYGKHKDGYKSDENLMIRYHTIFTYDENGNMIEENAYVDEGLNSKVKFEYDDDGNQIGFYTYQSDGSLQLKGTYKYDDDGNKIEFRRYIAEMESEFKKTYEYDDDGNMIVENSFDSEGEINKKRTYEYDKNGNKIQFILFSSDGSMSSKSNYEYDRNGNRTQEIRYKADGSLSEKKTYKYDDNGNLIEENSIHSSGEIYENWSYEYDYDKKGNWVKRIDFSNGVPKFLLLREYEYFN